MQSVLARLVGRYGPNFLVAPEPSLAVREANQASAPHRDNARLHKDAGRHRALLVTLAA